MHYELGFHKIGELCKKTLISNDLIIIYRKLGCLYKSNHPDDDKSRLGDVGGCNRVGLHGSQNIPQGQPTLVHVCRYGGLVSTL